MDYAIVSLEDNERFMLARTSILKNALRFIGEREEAKSIIDEQTSLDEKYNDEGIKRRIDLQTKLTKLQEEETQLDNNLIDLKPNLDILPVSNLVQSFDATVKHNWDELFNRLDNHINLVDEGKKKFARQKLAFLGSYTDPLNELKGIEGLQQLILENNLI